MVGELAEDVAVGGRRGEADGGAELFDGRGEIVRAGSLQQHGRGADPQRKQHEAAEPEGERDRRRADEAVVRRRAQHVLAEGVADRQHVAVEVHGALGHAGGAGGEGDQTNIVVGGVAGGEVLIARLRHQRFETVGAAGAPIDDALERRRERPRLFHLVGEPHVAQRELDRGLGQRERDLLGAQERHGRDHDAAGLDDGEIGRDHHRRVGAAQQHAVPRHQAEIAGEHVGDAVHPFGEAGIGQALGRRDQAVALAVALGDPVVDERGRRN